MWVSFRLTLALSWRAGDLIQQLVVELGAGAGLFGVGDVLAEVVHRDAQSRLVDRLRRAESIFHSCTRHKTAGQALPESRTLGHPA